MGAQQAGERSPGLDLDGRAGGGLEGQLKGGGTAAGTERQYSGGAVGDTLLQCCPLKLKRNGRSGPH